MTENGDLNPYAVIVAPVSAGKVMKDDVLVDNFNNISNLQGTGTTIVGYRPEHEGDLPVRPPAAEACRNAPAAWASARR